MRIIFTFIFTALVALQSSVLQGDSAMAFSDLGHDHVMVSRVQQSIDPHSLVVNPIQKVALVECEPQDMTRINVIWSTDHISYDHTKSMSQLGNMPIDTKSPYAAHVHTKVGGLMRGGLEVTTNYKISKVRYEVLRKNCVWMSDIDISIKINPTIFVASDYKKGSCMYNAVLEHEMKHIQVDRDVANKYQHYLRNMASQVSQKVGIIGPKGDSETRRSEKRVQKYFADHMNQVLETMYAERRQRQQAVDNIEEYTAVQNACNGRRDRR